MIAHRLLLLSVFRPSIEYGSEVWEGNKDQTGCGSLGVLLRPVVRQLEVKEPTSLSIFAPFFLEETSFSLFCVLQTTILYIDVWKAGEA